MHFLDIIIFTGIAFVLVFLLLNYRSKQRLKKRRIQLAKDWGKPKSDDYYYNFDAIAKYHLRTSQTDFHVLGNREIEDLDLREVFKHLNRTSSKIGEQYLYHKLLSIPEFEAREKSISDQKFFTDKDENLDIQNTLKQLEHPKVYQFEELVNGEQIKRPSYYPIILISCLTVVATFIFGFKFPALFLLLIPCYLINLFFHYTNKTSLNIYMDGLSQLFHVYKVAKQLKTFTSVQKLKKDTSFLTTLSRMKFKTQFLDDGKLMNNEFGVFFWILLEQIRILFNYETLIFFSLIDSINNNQKHLDNLFTYIGEIDIYVTLASLYADNKLICTPSFATDKEIKVSNMYHPLLEKPVSNSLRLNNKSLLLTGSNMSGKTTFIRTLALNHILAQTLNIAFAQNYQAPYARVFTSIRLTDDMLSNTSYFMEEVNQLKKFIAQSENPSFNLFVLDEIFKGTNTQERIAAAYGVLKYLNKANNIVLVSTHDIELTSLLNKHEYELFYFSENIDANHLSYDYKIKAGQLQNGNAIKILGLNDFPEVIVKDAQANL